MFFVTHIIVNPNTFVDGVMNECILLHIEPPRIRGTAFSIFLLQVTLQATANATLTIRYII